MRTLLMLPLLVLGACQVSESDNGVTVAYNQDVAENAVGDVANAAEDAGEAIANGTEEAVDTARNVDVDVDTNSADNRN